MSNGAKNLVGTILSGRYKIEKLIGEGGMGAIFQATQLSLGRLVAIKVVKSIHADADAVRRFELETEVIARLAHPHIVQVVDAGRSEDGTLFLAMELLEGDNVRGLLRKTGAFPLARVLAIVEDLASALSAAHAGGVIHRDLKAENVMLVKAAGKPEIAKVLDFGVAKLTSKTEAPPQTGSGFVAGTPGCIAPEQMLGKSDDPRSDLYSLGVLMFEMLAGVAPFTSESSIELMMRHLTEPAPRVAAVAAARGLGEIPQPVDDLVASLLAKDPDGRPASAEALVDIIVSLRDAGRATQADLPLMTPRGGFAVKTPGSSAVIAVQVPTAPTTTLPTPAAQPRLKKIAATLAISALLSYVGTEGSRRYADRLSASSDKEIKAAFEAVGHQLMSLDIEAARRSLDTIVRRDPDAPVAHLLLAQIAMLEGEPLSRIDGHLHDASGALERRAQVSLLRTHTEWLVSALTEIDPDKAHAKWQNHAGHCFDRELEDYMFAAKISYTSRDAAEIERLFMVRHLLFMVGHADFKDLAPASRLGVARARRYQALKEKLPVHQAAKLDDATKILEELLARHPNNAVIVDALVDVDVARGRTDSAHERLTALLQVDRRALRAQLRLAGLESIRDARAFDMTLAALRAAVPGNKDKVDGLASVGDQYASRGRFAEADGLWGEAVQASTSEQTRVAEIAVHAATFGILGGDLKLAKKWMSLYEESLVYIPSNKRLQLFHLANRILMAARSNNVGDERAEAELASMIKMKTDLPDIAKIASWYARTRVGKHKEALEFTQRLSPCFGPPHAGMSLISLNDPKEALATFKAATTAEMQMVCTSGDDVWTYIQSVLFANSLGHRAQVAMELGDRAEAEGAVKGLRAFWPYASSPPRTVSSNLAMLARVDKWLNAEAQP